MSRTLRARLKLAGWVFVFLWFTVGGIAHFAATETEMSIVAPCIPWPPAAVLLSGVFELLGGVGLLSRSTPRRRYRPLHADDRRDALHFYMLQSMQLTPGLVACLLHDAKSELGQRRRRTVQFQSLRSRLRRAARF